MNVAEKDISKQYLNLYNDYKKLLKYISSENSILDILNKIIDSVERRNPHMLCSVLLLDDTGKKLLKGAAPSLPDEYTNKLDEMLIGENVGSCGAAVYLKQRVVVSDISTHDNWKYAKKLAARFNLYACWSQPFFSANNEVLGSFAIYYNEIKEPSDFDIQLIEDIASIVGIAIEKYKQGLKEKEYKKELHQINHSLEEKVLERTSELERLNDKLEDTIFNLETTQNKLVESLKMASLGGLVAGVAHEINTPIGIGLTGSTHFLELTKSIKNKFENEEMTKKDFEEYSNDATELANLIYSNLKKTNYLIKSFKQISVDQTSEEKREFNLNTYINEILISINNVLKQTNISVIVKDDDKISLNSYPGAFSQIFTNLILNSLKHGYTKDEFGTIIIQLKKENNKTLIIYTDDGKGIKKENLNKIFDPFFTTNRNNGGSGLGLNIIYNIVTSQLKGTISCDSTVNMGVKFTIKI